MTTTRTIKDALAELLAHGYDAHLSGDGWLLVFGPHRTDWRHDYVWEVWFREDGTDCMEWGEVPQQVFDIAGWD